MFSCFTLLCTLYYILRRHRRPAATFKPVSVIKPMNRYNSTTAHSNNNSTNKKTVAQSPSCITRVGPRQATVALISHLTATAALISHHTEEDKKSPNVERHSSTTTCEFTILIQYRVLSYVVHT